MSEFEAKEDLLAVVAMQEPDLAARLVEPELGEALRDEPQVGPVTHIVPAIAHAPDPSALAAWVDDLNDYADDHRGDPHASKLLDKVASLDLDELAEVVRDHLKDTVSEEDEQVGIVNDFHADTALEGAAVEVREPGAATGSTDDLDFIGPSGSGKPFIEDYGSNGGGGGGGGAGSPGVPIADAAEPPPDEAKPGKAAATPATPSPKAEAPKQKPDKPAKPGDKKRDGER